MIIAGYRKQRRAAPSTVVAAGARVPAAFVAFACCPGHAGLRRSRPGGLDCLTSALVLGRGRTVGPESQKSLPLARAVLRARDLGSNVFDSLLLLTDNYILQLRTKPQSAQSPQRTHKEIRGGPPALRFLRATGSSAGQPLDRDCCRRSGSGCAHWPPLVSPAWAAMSSERAYV
ncbi:MAG: hypothetical protein NTY37_08940 [Methanothrix sp.]|nr:hypothetical protein [Methanothrix sp.]